MFIGVLEYIVQSEGLAARQFLVIAEEKLANVELTETEVLYAVVHQHTVVIARHAEVPQDHLSVSVH